MVGGLGVQGAIGVRLGAVAGVLLLVLLVAVALVALFTRRAHRPEQVTTWAAAHGLELTDRNRPLVRYYVQLAIVTRVIGAVAAMPIGAAFDRALGLRTSAGAGWWTWVISGWLVGALWAQRQVTTPSASPAVASLTPRRLADYLPAGYRWAPTTAALVVAAVTVAARALSTPENPEQTPLPPWSFLLGLVALTFGVAALVAVAQHRIVGRRQVPGAPDLVAADDAIRTSAIHQVAGAGTAIICSLGLAAHASVSAASWDGLPTVLAFAPLLYLLGALYSWRYLAYRAWRVRRSAGVGAPDPVAISP